MITPARAPVSPRVVSPEIHDVLPVEDALPDIEAGWSGAVEIVGGAGSGKTTALAHLAAVLPGDRGLVFLDDAPLESVLGALLGAPVVFTSTKPRPVPGGTSYRLAPWGPDELAEYLLAVHPDQCRSVLARLQAAADRRLPGGVPELCRVVLDRMAGDETISTVSEALRREIESRLPRARHRAEAEGYCLEVVSRRGRQPVEVPPLLSRASAASVMKLLRHEPVRLVLAAGRLACLLDSDAGRSWLIGRLPRALVKSTASLLSSAARKNLTVWLKKPEVACHAMAASLLHAADPQWAPTRGWPQNLAGAYFDGAQWKGVQLGRAALIGTDLTGSDLTGAVLDAATATRAVFVDSRLEGASLVRIKAEWADFTEAVLKSANARYADLRQAVLAGADLTDARLGDADLRWARLSGAKLAGADLTHAVLTDAKIDRADFSSADLRGATLNGLSLREARFSGARFAQAFLKKCNFEGMDLPGADFSRANLYGSLLTDSRMPGADFYGAELQGTGLAGVDWQGADLRCANMRGCTFHLGSSRSGLVGSPIACEGSRTGFYGDDFDDQTFRPPEEIRKANLCHADLRDASIDGADFYLVDLRWAKYTNAQLEHLRRCGAILFDRA